MVKGPKTYLFYCIVCIVLLVTSYYKLVVCNTREEWWVIFIPLIGTVVFLALYVFKTFTK